MYGRNTLIGNAGEMFLGYYVTHELKFIYRAQPIADIGIDGEIELLDEKNASTGKLVKVQVKSTVQILDKWNWKVKVLKRDVAYWKLLSIPVILVAVILGSKKCFYRLIDHTIILQNDDSAYMDIYFSGKSIDMQDVLLTKSELSKLEYANTGDKIVLEHMYSLLNRAYHIPQYGDPRLLVDDYDYYLKAEELRQEVSLLRPVLDRIPSLVASSSTKINRMADEVISICSGAMQYIDRNRD